MEVRRDGGGCANGELAGGLSYADVLRAENGREAQVRELGRALGHGEFLRSGSARRIERGVDSFERGGVVMNRVEGGDVRARVVAVGAGERGQIDERATGVRASVGRVMSGRLDLLG